MNKYTSPTLEPMFHDDALNKGMEPMVLTYVYPTFLASVIEIAGAAHIALVLRSYVFEAVKLWVSEE